MYINVYITGIICILGYPPVGSVATEGVLSEGYPPVWSVWHAKAECYLYSLQTWRENMAATFARFTQLLTIELHYRRRSMVPSRLYMNFCLSWSGLSCKSGMSPPFPTNVAAVFKIIKLYLLFVLGLLTKLCITLINSTLWELWLARKIIKIGVWEPYRRQGVAWGLCVYIKYISIFYID